MVSRWIPATIGEVNGLPLPECIERLFKMAAIRRQVLRRRSPPSQSYFFSFTALLLLFPTLTVPKFTELRDIETTADTLGAGVAVELGVGVSGGLGVGVGLGGSGVGTTAPAGKTTALP